MRYLIISDLHANMRALEAVVLDAAGAYDRVVCCGDLVGYGAEPNEVVDWVRETAVAVVRGNHDKACAGSNDAEWFNPVARSAVSWTRRMMSSQNLDYLRTLPRGPVRLDGFSLFHGAPTNEDEYVLTPYEASLAVPYLDDPLAFYGHSHVQGGFFDHRGGTGVITRPQPGERVAAVALEERYAYLVNVGSVGQPRDRDPRAAYALYDSETALVLLCRVAYDVQGAQEAIRAAGLPEWLADRLALGG